MLPHTSHLFQPLDVSCFLPLKRSYCQVVQELVHQGTHHIDKEDFLLIYINIQPIIFSEQNIKSSFQATGLILYNLQHVLLLLTVTKNTITTWNIPWSSTTVDFRNSLYDSSA
jgi:hypothetical protein